MCASSPEVGVERLGKASPSLRKGLSRHLRQHIGPAIDQRVEGGVGQRLLHLGQEERAEPLLFILRERLRAFDGLLEEGAHAEIVARTGCSPPGSGRFGRLPAAKDLVVLGVRANPPPDDCITGTHAKGPIPASDSG